MSVTADARDPGAMLDEVARSQGVSAGDVAKMLVAFPESLQALLAAAWRVDGAAGFLGAYQILDVLEELGCVELEAPDPDCLDPVHLAGRRVGSGAPAHIQVTRLAWRLGRQMLTSLLRQQIGDDRLRFSVGRGGDPELDELELVDDALSDEVPDATPSDSQIVDLTLSGNVDQIAVPDLLRMLARNGRTGALRLGAGGRQLGAVYLYEGRAVHAISGEYRGVDAVAALATCVGAVFVFTTETPSERTLDLAMEVLVMEAMRVIDEDRLRA